jgi:hypothetical protein
MAGDNSGGEGRVQRGRQSQEKGPQAPGVGCGPLRRASLMWPPVPARRRPLDLRRLTCSVEQADGFALAVGAESVDAELAVVREGHEPADVAGWAMSTAMYGSSQAAAFR